MQLSAQPSSKAISTTVADRRDPTLPAILEFQSPSTAIVNAPMPRAARGISLTIGSMVLASLAALSVIEVDKVVTTTGKVVSRSPTIVVQPLDTAIVRSIEVREGEIVRAGQILARLDPTFAAADLGALATQVSLLQAQVTRMQAEVDGKPRPEPVLAGGDLRAAYLGVQFPSRELSAKGRQPFRDPRPRPIGHGQLPRPAGVREATGSDAA